jgi:small conductance mechanosensitive channel
MMNMNLDGVTSYLATHGMDLALKLAGAVAIWVIGRWIISLVMRVTTRAISRGGKIDATLSKYITSILSVLLTVGLAVGILGFLGVQTTTFAALLAGAGLAIGTAWGGLLTHFAAGAFLQVLRPFKVGDYVTAGGIEGTVQEIGLFGTTILTGDNVTTTVGNNKVFSETIKNFSTQPFRRVDSSVRLAHGYDAAEAIARIKASISKIPNVIAKPAPEVEIIEFLLEGPRLAVRPYCHTDHYWQVMFDTNRLIIEAVGTGGYPIPALPTKNPLTGVTH